MNLESRSPLRNLLQRRVLKKIVVARRVRSLNLLPEAALQSHPKAPVNLLKNLPVQHLRKMLLKLNRRMKVRHPR